MDNKDLKQKAGDLFWGAAKKVSDTCEQHGEELKVIVPLAAGILAAGGKFASNQMKRKREDNHKNCEFYDARTHRWAFTRRPLRPQEQFEVARRYAAGESYEEIFYRMRLLK